jgi:hypothetical protein
MSKIYISKLDAAKRQLDVAINLFFRSGDPVSIHTLTAAAYDVLIGLGKTAKVVDLGIKDVELYVKEEHQKEYLAIVNKAQNFFKHSDKDPKEIIEFDPDSTTLFLLSAVKLYIELTKEKPNNMLIYTHWFALMYPDLLKDEYKEEYKYRRSQLNPADRSKFLDLIHILDKSK